MAQASDPAPGGATTTATATPPPSSGAPNPEQSSSPPRVRRWLRWPLRAYRVLIALLFTSLIGNIAVVPLAEGTSNWLASAQGQVNALLALAQQYPLQVAGGLIVLYLLYMLASRAEAQEQREEKLTEDARLAVLAGNAAGTALAEALPEMTEQLAQEAARRAVEAAERIVAALPPVPTRVVSPQGLPRAAHLVGRTGELATLMDALRGNAGPVGVFALEGLGGVGKTALAAEAVARLSEDRVAFPGGAAWIACEGLTGEEGLADLWSRVARAMGAEQVAALPDAERRRTALRAALADPARPRLLLALDNLEPDLDADAVLDTLGGGQATLLLTARQAVSPARLTALTLDPLPDPDAVTLFTQRLRQVDPARPRPEEQGDLEALVRLVGGLPLAVELAAAYAGVQRRPLSEIVAEVRQDGLEAGALNETDPLRVARRGVRPRFDRSWRVLSEAQRRLFAGLSLLEGATFPRAAALALTAPSRVPPASPPAPDLAPAAPRPPPPLPHHQQPPPTQTPQPDPMPPTSTPS